MFHKFRTKTICLTLSIVCSLLIMKNAICEELFIVIEDGQSLRCPDLKGKRYYNKSSGFIVNGDVGSPASGGNSISPWSHFTAEVSGDFVRPSVVPNLEGNVIRLYCTYYVKVAGKEMANFVLTTVAYKAKKCLGFQIGSNIAEFRCDPY